jgi:hypothetical protein
VREALTQWERRQNGTHLVRTLASRDLTSYSCVLYYAVVNTKSSTAKVVVTSIRVPEDLHRRFKEIAASERRSVTGELTRLMDRHVAEYDEREAA